MNDPEKPAPVVSFEGILWFIPNTLGLLSTIKWCSPLVLLQNLEQMVPLQKDTPMWGVSLGESSPLNGWHVDGRRSNHQGWKCVVCFLLLPPSWDNYRKLVKLGVKLPVC